jgi:hypothetical protein
METKAGPSRRRGGRTVVSRKPTDGSRKSVSRSHPLLLSRRERHRRQLGVLEAFFLSAGARELRDAPIPTATTREEIAERKRELGFRLELLRAILDQTRRELKALRRHPKRRR